MGGDEQSLLSSGVKTLTLLLYTHGNIACLAFISGACRIVFSACLQRGLCSPEASDHRPLLLPSQHVPLDRLLLPVHLRQWMKNLGSMTGHAAQDRLCI